MHAIEILTYVKVVAAVRVDMSWLYAEETHTAIWDQMDTQCVIVVKTSLHLIYNEMGFLDVLSVNMMYVETAFLIGQYIDPIKISFPFHKSIRQ